MKIVISGASGFVGSRLVAFLRNKNYQVETIERVLLDGKHSAELIKKLQCSDVVINLAGANLNHRWTPEYKKLILDSRVLSTRYIVNAINALKNKPSVFISTSAVGYYPSIGKFDEFNEKKGDTFLSDVCEKWEMEAKNVSHDVRCVITRFGVVFSKNGGAFLQIIKTIKYGFAANIASGEQCLSWIDIEDLLRAYDFVINDRDLWGVVNFTTVTPVAYKDIVKELSKHYKTNLTLNVPAFVLRLMKGESADVVLIGQKVYPTKLTNAGFVFHSKSIEQFLNNVFI